MMFRITSTGLEISYTISRFNHIFCLHYPALLIKYLLAVAKHLMSEQGILAQTINLIFLDNK